MVEALRDLSPLMHVGPQAPPTILVHGDADTNVPVQQSYRVKERLDQANVPARLIIRQEMAHAWHFLDDL